MDIKEIRAKARMTQREFAEYFGIPQRTIENWEGGQTKPASYVVDLIKYKAEKERLGMLKLNLLEEGTKETLVEGELDEVVEYLESNYQDLFSWIWEDENMYPELSHPEKPEFKNVGDVEDLEVELEKVNLDWWTLEVE